MCGKRFLKPSFDTQDNLTQLREVFGFNTYKIYNHWKIIHRNVRIVTDKNFFKKAMHEIQSFF